MPVSRARKLPVKRANGGPEVALQQIRIRPGICKLELAAAISRGWGTTGYYVRRLQGAGQICTMRQGGRLCLFPAASTPQERIRWAAGARSPEVLRVLVSPMSLSQVCKRLGLTRRVVQRQMTRLREAGMVDVSQERVPVYCLTMAGQAVVTDIKTKEVSLYQLAAVGQPL